MRLYWLLNGESPNHFIFFQFLYFFLLYGLSLMLMFKTPLVNIPKRDSIGYLKGVFAKNERGYRLNAIKKRF